MLTLDKKTRPSKRAKARYTPLDSTEIGSTKKNAFFYKRRLHIWGQVTFTSAVLFPLAQADLSLTKRGMPVPSLE